MAETSNWAFPTRLQPRPEELRFDLEAALRSVVLVHAEIPDQAFTAAILGTERIGHGTVIGADGLVLTIGYLITEAESIWLTTQEERLSPDTLSPTTRSRGSGSSSRSATWMFLPSSVAPPRRPTSATVSL